MKNRIPTLAVLYFLASPALVLAQSATASTGKIGVINIQDAIASTQEGKKALSEIQRKFQPRQAELQREQQEINALTDQLQKQANTLSDEEQRRLSRQLEEKQRLFKRASEDADSDYRAEGQDVIQRIGLKMVPLINDYAQKNGFTLIFDPTAVPVYYVAPEVVVTPEIIKRYDAANPVTAEATGPAAPATPAARPPGPSSRPLAAKPVDRPKP